MAYPPGITQATITVGTAIGWFGEPVTKLSVSITPVIGGNATQLVHRATATTMHVTSKTWTDDGTGIVTFTLPHVDQRGWFDGIGKEITNWGYRAIIVATFPGGNQSKRSFAFQVFSDQDEVDLDLIEDGQISAPVGAVVPAVTSVNGKTGAVTLEGLGGYDDTEIVARVQALEGRPTAGTPTRDAPEALDRKNLVSIVGDSFSSTGYGTNHGHVWHTVALAHADGVLVGNYAKNGHTAADAVEGRTADWGPDPANSQLTKAKQDDSQTVVVCLGYNDENNGVPVETYQDNLRRIATELRDAGKRVVLVQPPIPLAARAAAIPTLQDYTAGLPALAEATGALHLRTWDLLGDDLGQPVAWDQGDGSHMTAAGHEAIGLVVAPRLRLAIGGLGEYAAATRTATPLPGPVEVMNDAASTATVQAVPESSRDLFPSGQAYLMDLSAADGSYVSLGMMCRHPDLPGSLVKFTFAYEVASMPEDRVNQTTTNAGLYVQAGTFSPWLFRTVWGGVKLQGARGVASVVTRVPEDVSEWVYALTLNGVVRTADDAPARVWVGSARIERIV